MSEGHDHPICLRIAEARRASGMKAYEFARALDTHAAMVSRWEHRIVPPVATLVQIAEVTGVSIDWLARGEGRGPATPTEAA